MKYAIHSTGNTTWEPCNATTLAEAKLACTAEYGAGPNGDILSVAEVYGQGEHQRFITKAERPNCPGEKWRATN
jgi:hypothetical protein